MKNRDQKECEQALARIASGVTWQDLDTLSCGSFPANWLPWIQVVRIIRGPCPPPVLEHVVLSVLPRMRCLEVLDLRDDFYRPALATWLATRYPTLNVRQNWSESDAIQYIGYAGMEDTLGLDV